MEIWKEPWEIQMVEIIVFFASIAYAFVIQHFSAPFMVIMNFYAGISVINLN